MPAHSPALLRTRWSACIATAAVLTACALPSAPPATEAALPTGFVHLTALAPDIRQEMRYHGGDNFVGRPVAAYDAPTCILSEPAARALQAAQAELRPQGMALKVFDCYRPQAAVDDFVRWGRDLADQKTKPAFYPDVPKQELFQRGYIAEKSGHSRGSTVDLTLVVHDRAKAFSVKIGLGAIVGGAIYLVWANLAYGIGLVGWLLTVVAAVGLIASWFAMSKGRDGWAFTSTTVAILAVAVWIFVRMWPTLGFINSGVGLPLDRVTAASTELTLTIMTGAAIVFVPIVLAYQGWSVWVFRKRLSTKNIPDDVVTAA